MTKALKSILSRSSFGSARR